METILYDTISTEEAEERTVTLKDGTQINTKRKTFYSANIIEAEAGIGWYGGHNCGDHGGSVLIKLKDQGSTQWKTYADESQVSLYLEGSTEVSTIIEALKFVVETLEQRRIECLERRIELLETAAFNSI